MQSFSFRASLVSTGMPRLENNQSCTKHLTSGMQTLLVLSGVTSRAELHRAQGNWVPDYVAASVASLGAAQQ